MPHKFFFPVKQVSESSQATTKTGFTQIFGNIDHFGVKIADPL
jgi:hypothetical protein